MKKIYKLLVSAIAFFAILPSCSQLLEPEPYGLVELDLVWTKYNYTSTLVGTIGNASEWNSTWGYAAYTDEAQHVQDRTGGAYYNWYTKDFLSGTFPLGSNYSGIYNNIRTINFFLTNQEKWDYRIQRAQGKTDEELTTFTNVDDEELDF